MLKRVALFLDRFSLDLADQKVSCFIADRVLRLSDGREGRDKHLRDGRVVKADDGNILRHFKAVRVEGADRTDRAAV